MLQLHIAKKKYTEHNKKHEPHYNPGMNSEAFCHHLNVIRLFDFNELVCYYIFYHTANGYPLLKYEPRGTCV